MHPPTTKDLTSFIWKFVSLQFWGFFFIYFLSLAWAVEVTVWPYIIRIIIDTFATFDTNRLEAWDTLKWIIPAAIFLWIFVELCFRARDFLRAKAFPKLEANIRMAMFDHVQHHSPKYFNQHFSGSLANKINDMVTQVSFILYQFSMFISAIAVLAITLLFFFEINYIFSIILTVWILIHFGICFYFAPRCVQYSNVHGESRSLLSGKIVDSFTNNFAVNLFNRFKFEKARILESQKIEMETNARAQYYIAYMFISLSVLFILAMIILNSFLIIYWMQNNITSGEAVQVFYTTSNVLMLMWTCGDLLPQFYKSFGIAKQALTVMNDPRDVDDTPQVKHLQVSKGEIIFNNISFQYGEKKLFENKEVSIKAGEKVGLVGYSGAGKSTFVNLILRFYSPTHGKILIDGQDIAHVTLESLREQIALVPQDPILFHRTLEENIQYGNINASTEEITTAAKLAHCDHFISKFPEGYKTLVGERGTKLSGGEKQRIAIARAMLTSAKILIFDEATSALDSITENFIQDSLELLMKNRTTIVIAHRLSTLAKMDRILVFDQGKIVEQGSHKDLLSKKGLYAHLWEMQSGGFLPDAK